SSLTANGGVTGDVTLDNYTLNNGSREQYLDGESQLATAHAVCYIVMKDGAVFNNYGTVTLPDDKYHILGSYQTGSDLSTFNNYGLLEKTGGYLTGYSLVRGVAINSPGAVNVMQGILG